MKCNLCAADIKLVMRINTHLDGKTCSGKYCEECARYISKGIGLRPVQ